MERSEAYPVSAAEFIHLDVGQDEPQQAADALSIVEEAAVGGELKGGVLTPLALRRPRGGDALYQCVGIANSWPRPQLYQPARTACWPSVTRL